MKKLKLSLSNVKGAELLSREQLKNVMGGSGSGSGGCSAGPCTLTVQGTNGSYITRNGTCATHSAIWGAGVVVTSCYCDAGLGNVPLSSNGGISRCTL